MLFNSLIFAVYLPIVFLVYWFIFNKNLIKQNTFLIIASYFFYGWWDWRFLTLIFSSSFLNFFLAKFIDDKQNTNKKHLLLILSLIINLGTLFYFKYCNFFIENFILLSSKIGFQLESSTLNIILPIGISFYTFQTISYTIDVYRKEIAATKDPVVFFAFISFFPQLVAGPIERAKNLLPQFTKNRNFNYDTGAEGARLILWGFFKKVVIADNCAFYVNQIFDTHELHSGSTLFLGLILFAFQVYGDFSGYSDIAVGVAKLFGIELMDNFRYPYFSTSISEFWRRWHISLSTWLRDYLYTPLAIKTREWEMKGIIFSTIVSFTIIGFWHGANWTYIVFGLIHGVFISFEILTAKKRKRVKKKVNKTLYFVFSLFITFNLYLLSLVFFRCDSIEASISYLSNIFSSSFFELPEFIAPKFRFLYTLLTIIFFIIVEWIQKDKKHVLDIKIRPELQRWVIYFSIILLILFFGRFNNNDFIYFQF